MVAIELYIYKKGTQKYGPHLREQSASYKKINGPQSENNTLRNQMI